MVDLIKDWKGVIHASKHSSFSYKHLETHRIDNMQILQITN